MIIECELCDAKYNISDSKIPEGGTRMRCKKCQTIINIQKESTTPEIDSAPAPEPEAQSEVLNKAKDTASALSEKALNFGKKAKEKANSFRELTNNKSSGLKSGQIDSSNKGARFNRFLLFSFKIGKYISAFCIVLFFLVFIGAAIFYLSTFGTSLEKPEFDPNKFKAGKSVGVENYDQSGKQARKEVEDKYEKQVKFVVQLIYKQEYWSKYYDNYFNKLARMDEDYRGEYINGLVEFFEDAGEHYQTEGQRGQFPGYYELQKAYDERFQAEVIRDKSEQKSAEQRRLIILGVIAASMFLYIIFLMIPILIKIEENTRHRKTGNSPEMELAAAQNEHANSTIRRESSTIGNATSAQS